jgi:NADPH:quinone reductase-like Zn-dependent oxidoreductase
MTSDQSLPLTMRSLATKNYGKPNTYEILDLPVPKIIEVDDILIKVSAASLNPIDVKLATGTFKGCGLAREYSLHTEAILLCFQTFHTPL